MKKTKQLQVGRGSPIYDFLIETLRLRLRVKKTMCWGGANPRPMVLNASALPIHHSDLLFQIISSRVEIKYNRSECCRGKALAFKTKGRGFAPRQILSCSHVYVGDAFQLINHIMAERRRNTTGRSGVWVRRWRSKP